MPLVDNSDQQNANFAPNPKPLPSPAALYADCVRDSLSHEATQPEPHISVQELKAICARIHAPEPPYTVRHADELAFGAYFFAMAVTVAAVYMGSKKATQILHDANGKVARKTLSWHSAALYGGLSFFLGGAAWVLLAFQYGGISELLTVAFVGVIGCGIGLIALHGRTQHAEK